MSLTVTAVSASTDIAIADGAPEAATVAHAVGAPITLTFLVSNTGTAVTQANAYINFSEPVFVQSVNASIGSCSGGASTTASLSCAIGAMATPDNATVTMVVVPGLVRDVNASAVVNSEDEDTNVSNNTVTLTPRQVRVRPLARQNLPAKLP